MSPLLLTELSTGPELGGFKDGNVWHQFGQGPDQPGQVEGVPGSCLWQGVAMK